MRRGKRKYDCDICGFTFSEDQFMYFDGVRLCIKHCADKPGRKGTWIPPASTPDTAYRPLTWEYDFDNEYGIITYITESWKPDSENGDLTRIDAKWYDPSPNGNNEYGTIVDMEGL